MTPLVLHEVHAALDARFTEVNGHEVAADYGDWLAEHAALRTAAAVSDLSFRGRLCLTGEDRIRLLNGQVTNDVKTLAPGTGCHAAFCSPKGRLVADAYIYALPQELLLDFEPGLTAPLLQRLEHHIVAEDVQVVEVAPYYGLFTVQGPQAAEVVGKLGLFPELPSQSLAFASASDPTLGELYLMNHARAGFTGFDLFVPTDALAAVLDKLVAAAKEVGGRLAGFTALEAARFEAGIPRFGIEMDETHLPPEAGLERDAISYTKGCYTGQETIARIRTYGQVTKALRGLRLADELAILPVKGDKLVKDGREVGTIMSALKSPATGHHLALGYVRKECNGVGTGLTLRTAAGESAARIVAVPFEI
ncbi:MAG TPA: aminomethyltransferase family protein [Candidatus Limnocylindria bacterium]|jgi:folate-binding protein YgfZ|nr:aminomethyltransferase family protein [Candidatus Limnocylindria bacterium]